jgi:hypothetical protein
MAVNISNIIPAKTAENSQTTQYTSNGVQTIIDKFTATNYSVSAATISVNLVTAAGSASNDNLIVGDVHFPGTGRACTAEQWLHLDHRWHGVGD